MVFDQSASSTSRKQYKMDQIGPLHHTLIFQPKILKVRKMSQKARKVRISSQKSELPILIDEESNQYILVGEESSQPIIIESSQESEASTISIDFSRQKPEKWFQESILISSQKSRNGESDRESVLVISSQESGQCSPIYEEWYEIVSWESNSSQETRGTSQTSVISLDSEENLDVTENLDSTVQ